MLSSLMARRRWLRTGSACERGTAWIPSRAAAWAAGDGGDADPTHARRWRRPLGPEDAARGAAELAHDVVPRGEHRSEP